MEGDKPADNEKELTSTSSSVVGKLLSTNKEKTDSNDTLPTSSTDASTSIQSTNLVSDDPISSTSSEMDPTKPKAENSSSSPVDISKASATFDTEAELLGMSIVSKPSENIEENVDDLVNDLETLLGESTDPFTIPKTTEVIDEKTTEVIDEKTDVPAIPEEDTKLSAIPEEDTKLPIEKPEDDVSSNTDTNPDKIGAPEVTTEGVPNKLESRIEDTIYSKSLEDVATTCFEQKETTSENVESMTNYVESNDDIFTETAKPDDISSENSSNLEDEKEESVREGSGENNTANAECEKTNENVAKEQENSEDISVTQKDVMKESHVEFVTVVVEKESSADSEEAAKTNQSNTKENEPSKESSEDIQKDMTKEINVPSMDVSVVKSVETVESVELHKDAIEERPTSEATSDGAQKDSEEGTSAVEKEDAEQGSKTEIDESDETKESEIVESVETIEPFENILKQNETSQGRSEIHKDGVTVSSIVGLAEDVEMEHSTNVKDAESNENTGTTESVTKDTQNDVQEIFQEGLTENVENDAPSEELPTEQDDFGSGYQEPEKESNENTGTTESVTKDTQNDVQEIFQEGLTENVENDAPSQELPTEQDDFGSGYQEPEKESNENTGTTESVTKDTQNDVQEIFQEGLTENIVNDAPSEELPTEQDDFGSGYQEPEKESNENTGTTESVTKDTQNDVQEIFQEGLTENVENDAPSEELSTEQDDFGSGYQESEKESNENTGTTESVTKDTQNYVQEIFQENLTENVENNAQSEELPTEQDDFGSGYQEPEKDNVVLESDDTKPTDREENKVHSVQSPDMKDEVRSSIENSECSAKEIVLETNADEETKDAIDSFQGLENTKSSSSGDNVQEKSTEPLSEVNMSDMKNNDGIDMEVENVEVQHCEGSSVPDEDKEHEEKNTENIAIIENQTAEGSDEGKEPVSAETLVANQENIVEGEYLKENVIEEITSEESDGFPVTQELDDDEKNDTFKAEESTFNIPEDSAAEKASDPEESETNKIEEESIVTACEILQDCIVKNQMPAEKLTSENPDELAGEPSSKRTTEPLEKPDKLKEFEKNEPIKENETEENTESGSCPVAQEVNDSKEMETNKPKESTVRVPEGSPNAEKASDPEEIETSKMKESTAEASEISQDFIVEDLAAEKLSSENPEELASEPIEKMTKEPLKEPAELKEIEINEPIDETTVPKTSDDLDPEQNQEPDVPEESVDNKDEIRPLISEIVADFQNVNESMDTSDMETVIEPMKEHVFTADTLDDSTKCLKVIESVQGTKESDVAPYDDMPEENSMEELDKTDHEELEDICKSIEEVEDQPCVEEKSGASKASSPAESGSIQEQDSADLPAESRSILEQDSAESESVEQQPVENTKENPEDNEQQSVENIEETDEDNNQSEVPIIPEDPKCSKDISETFEEIKISQDACKTQKESKGIIKITELPDDVTVTDNAEVVETNTIVNEPEDAPESSEAAVSSKDNIEEVSDEEMVKEHLEEIKDAATIVDADKNLKADDDIDKNAKGPSTQDLISPQDMMESSEVTGIPDFDPETNSSVQPSEELKQVEDVQIDEQVSLMINTDTEDKSKIDQIREDIGESSVQVLVSCDSEGFSNAQQKESCQVIENMDSVDNIVDKHQLMSTDLHRTIDVAIQEEKPISQTIDAKEVTEIASSGRVLEKIQMTSKTNTFIEYNEVEGKQLISRTSEAPKRVPVAGISKEKEKHIEMTSKNINPVEQKSIAQRKPVPEINIRRKTVEQDLEKVVCLSEESSDSDSNGPVSSLPKPIQDDLPPFDEERNLIQIAEEADQFSDPDITCEEESMPVIEDVLSVQSQVIPSVTPVDSASNLETILAVASLQNESVSDVRVERRLSEKEIQEMEALRMAVASITDSSQDTYDSYLVDNSITMDNSIQEISNDAQEFTNEAQEISSETLSEDFVEGDTLLSRCSVEPKEDSMVKSCEILPIYDNQPEEEVGKEVSNSSQNEANFIESNPKNVIDNEVDEPTTSADTTDKLESIPSTESSEVIDSVDSQSLGRIEETESLDTPEEISEDAKASSEVEVLQQEVEAQVAAHSIDKENHIAVLEQKSVKNDVTVAEEKLNNEVALPDDETQKPVENAVTVTEDELQYKFTLPNDEALKEDESVSKEITKENVVLKTDTIHAKEKAASVTNAILNENEVSNSKDKCNENDISPSEDVIEETDTSPIINKVNVILPGQLADQNKCNDHKKLPSEVVSEEANTSTPIINKVNMILPGQPAVQNKCKDNEKSPSEVVIEEANTSSPIINKENVILPGQPADQNKCKDNEISPSEVVIEEANTSSPIINKENVIIPGQPADQNKCKENEKSSSEVIEEPSPINSKVNVILPGQLADQNKFKDNEKSPSEVVIEEANTSSSIINKENVILPGQPADQNKYKDNEKSPSEVIEEANTSSPVINKENVILPGQPVEQNKCKDNEKSPSEVVIEEANTSSPVINKENVILPEQPADQNKFKDNEKSPSEVVIEEANTSSPIINKVNVIRPGQPADQNKFKDNEKSPSEVVIEEANTSSPIINKKVIEVLPEQPAEQTELPVIQEHSLELNDISVSKEVEVEKEAVAVAEQVVEGRPLRRTRRGNKVSEPLSISVEEVDKKEKVYSPKITIKPVRVPDEEVSTTSDAEGNKGSLKMTITKQSDKLHSILKVYNPEDETEAPQNQEEPIPKLIIKPKIQQVEQQHSPKMTTRSSKSYSPTSTRCSSPRITIKPVTKQTEAKAEGLLSPLKITFKPVIKPDEGTKRHSPKPSKDLDQKTHNPKITIKPIPKPTEVEKEETSSTTPKVTIKPIKRHLEETDTENEERSSPKITIKPVVKPVEQDCDHLPNQTTPKLKIKPIKKHDDEEIGGLESDQTSSKISIKPVVKPPELEAEEEEIKERIVLKINKGNLPTPTKESKKREHPGDDKSEKVAIKLKFSTTGGHTHIIQEGEESNKRQRKDSGYSGNAAKKDIDEPSHKRALEEKLPEKNKRLRSSLTPDKLNKDSSDDLKNVDAKVDSPIVISEDSRSQHSADSVMLDDSNPAGDISKIADIASRTTHIEASPVLTVGIASSTVTATPKKRGRPRKVPREVREAPKDPPTTPQLTPQVTPQTTPVVEEAASTPASEVGTPEATPSPGGRPKRSCRGQSVMTTLGIKPRKPRGGGRGRGGKVNMGDREPQVLSSPVEPQQTVSMKPEKEPKLTKPQQKLMQKAAEEEVQKRKEVEPKQKGEKVQKEASAKQKEEEENKKAEIQLSKEKAQVEKKEKTPIKQEEAEQKDLVETPKKGAAAKKLVELENTGNPKEDTLKRKKDEPEQSSPKKKKEEKTPPRKLEVTTRRQKAQQLKEAEKAEKTSPTESSKLVPQKTSPVEAPKPEPKNAPAAEIPKSEPKKTPPADTTPKPEPKKVLPTESLKPEIKKALSTETSEPKKAPSTKTPEPKKAPSTETLEPTKATENPDPKRAQPSETPKPDPKKATFPQTPKPESKKAPHVDTPRPGPKKAPHVDTPRPEPKKAPHVDTPRPEPKKAPHVDTPRPEPKKAAAAPKNNPKKVAVPTTSEPNSNTNNTAATTSSAETVSIEVTPRTSALVDKDEVVIISTDDDSCEKEHSSATKTEEVKDKGPEQKAKNSPENKISPKNSPPKRAAEKSEEKPVEAKKQKVETEENIIKEKKGKVEVQTEIAAAEPTGVIDKKEETLPKVEEKKSEVVKGKQEEVREKQLKEKYQEEEEKDRQEEEQDKKEEEEEEGDTTVDGETKEGASGAEEEEASGDDSEAERRKEWVLQRKQEAIKKCRAKRLEKLARAAELKKKRQELAAQQREARKAAEEADRSTDKGRATKRYGRYGEPKPQISLIDAPVQEEAGTIKSCMGLFDPEYERLNITQPIHIDDDSSFDKGHFTPEKSSPQKLSAPESMIVDSADDTPTKVIRSLGSEDVLMVDEETRMSADFRGSSRSQTPAKQTIPPPDLMVDDSQGSIGTEGGKSRSSKAPRMEVFQDLEAVAFTAEQLAEYSWNGQGPFMVQEQVAHYLGIKSFKRKYPLITRRPVDMQERDYLKENGLATEAQCDLGLTAVIAQDILDIMYSDFQEKYEDYCRCQREKQARELANKQKALSQFVLKPGFDKLDILEQAVQSAAAWNQQFNKARKEQRKSHMDLQNLTVHYPKSKMKVVPTGKIGHYPVALVPGQFTDHYKEFTPTELNNLPLNTMCYDEIKVPGFESDSEDSSSGSDSDSESTSGSSSSDSSCDDEDCKDCVKKIKMETNGVDSDDVVIIENDASSSDSCVLVSVTAAPVTA